MVEADTIFKVNSISKFPKLVRNALKREVIEQSEYIEDDEYTGNTKE